MIHKVQAGDCIGSIAASHGFTWERIWDHADNQALRELGREPNLLVPGDIVHIPKRKERVESIQTDQSHRYQIRRQVTKLRLRLVLSLEPADAEPYVLVFSGKRVEGKTDSNGLLEVVIPTSVRVADLLLPEREMKFHLQIGDLEPANTTRGLQSRLTNLSLFMGNSNGDLDGTTRAEILHFQSANDIDPSGGHDEETTAALADMHGV